MRTILIALSLLAGCSSSHDSAPDMISACPADHKEFTSLYCNADQICRGHIVTDGGFPDVGERKCVPKPAGCGAVPTCDCVPDCQGCQITHFGSGAVLAPGDLVDCTN